MSLKDLVDALDGFVNDDMDLSSRLRKSAPQDLRAAMVQEKYGNRVSPALKQESREDEFFIEGFPSSGRTAPLKEEIPKRQEKPVADALLEALDGIQKPKGGKEPTQESSRVSPQKPRQAQRINREEVDVDAIVESLKEDVEDAPSFSSGSFLNKMMSTGKLGGALADAVPYQRGIDEEQAFSSKGKSSGSSLLGRMMSTGKLGGAVDKSQLEKPPIIEEMDEDGEPVARPARATVNIDVDSGMPTSLKQGGSGVKPSFNLGESFEPAEPEPRQETAEDPSLHSVIVLPQIVSEEKSCSKAAYLSRSKSEV
jgi:hypothetical protein